MDLITRFFLFLYKHLIIVFNIYSITAFCLALFLFHYYVFAFILGSLHIIIGLIIVKYEKKIKEIDTIKGKLDIYTEKLRLIQINQNELPSPHSEIEEQIYAPDGRRNWSYFSKRSRRD